MTPHMPRLTITLPDALDATVRQRAATLGVSVAQLVRHALADHLNQPRALSFAKLGSSGHTDTARRAEEILRDEWNPLARRQP
jgi:plasmid stability protein